MYIYFDFEFTDLNKNCYPLQVSFRSDNNATFNAIFKDNLNKPCSDFVKQNILPKLEDKIKSPQDNIFVGDTYSIKSKIESFLDQFREQAIIYFVADVPVFDWILLTDLIKLPSNASYIVLDLATLLFAKGIDPDIPRNKIFKVDQHDSIEDCIQLKEIFERYYPNYY
jgi:hypothetical protein